MSDPYLCWTVTWLLPAPSQCTLQVRSCPSPRWPREWPGQRGPGSRRPCGLSHPHLFLGERWRICLHLLKCDSLEVKEGGFRWQCLFCRSHQHGNCSGWDLLYRSSMEMLSSINVKVTTTSKELPFHRRCQKNTNPFTNWPPNILPCLYLILPTGKLSYSELSPGFFPYFSPGLPQPLFQTPANHSSASARGVMGTSPGPHLLPSTLQQTLGAVSSFLQSVFLQPHTFHWSTLHCESPIPIWDTSCMQWIMWKACQPHNTHWLFRKQTKNIKTRPLFAISFLNIHFLVL